MRFDRSADGTLSAGDSVWRHGVPVMHVEVGEALAHALYRGNSEEGRKTPANQCSSLHGASYASCAHVAGESS